MTCPVLYLIHTNQHWQHPEKDKKQSETQKQDRRWQKIQGSKDKETKLISKKVWRKCVPKNILKRNFDLQKNTTYMDWRNIRKTFSKKKLIDTLCESIIKDVDKEHVSSKNIRSNMVAQDEEYHHPFLNKPSSILRLFKK